MNHVGEIWKSKAVQETSAQLKRHEWAPALHIQGTDSLERKLIIKHTFPDVPVAYLNCREIKLNAIELELFGRISYTPTGQKLQIKGKVHDAIGGVLFIDNIHVLDEDIQYRFKHFLDSRETMPLPGYSDDREKVELRVITGSDKPIRNFTDTGLRMLPNPQLEEHLRKISS